MHDGHSSCESHKQKCVTQNTDHSKLIYYSISMLMTAHTWRGVHEGSSITNQLLFQILLMFQCRMLMFDQAFGTHLFLCYFLLHYQTNCLHLIQKHRMKLSRQKLIKSLVRFYPSFCSMKQLQVGIFPIPPGWDASPSLVSPHLPVICQVALTVCGHLQYLYQYPISFIWIFYFLFF